MRSQKFEIRQYPVLAYLKPTPLVQEQSRISLILEENVEEEDLKNEINNLMTKMAAQSQNSKVFITLLNSTAAFWLLQTRDL